MNFAAPRGLIGAVLILWGVQVELIIFSIVMALIIESDFIVKIRLDLTNKHLNRISDLATVSFVLLLVYGISTSTGTEIVALLLKWLPVVFFPVIFMQRFSQWKEIPLSVISLKARKQEARNKEARKIMDPIKTVDMSYIYFFATVVSSGSTLRLNNYYFFLMSAFVLLALFKIRGGRFNKLVFAILAIVSIGLGYVTSQGIYKAQVTVERYSERWIRDWLRKKNQDPLRRNTAIGSIGRIKDSNYILMRVKSDSEVKMPLLLVEGVYNRYISGTWYSDREESKVVEKISNYRAFGWDLRQGEYVSGDYNILTITTDMDDGKGLIALPLDSFFIKNIPGSEIKMNNLGTLSITGTPEFLDYKVYRTNGLEPKDNPNSEDLVVPEMYKNALSGVLKEAISKEGIPDEKLHNLSEKDKLQILKRLFLRDYSYSLDLDVHSLVVPSIIDFLKNTKKGHCEYFATASVLLMREMGIPARYVYGYSVQDFSELEEQYIVRDRHAHAWAVAYIDGKWINVDNTPPDWSSLEAESETFLTPVYSFFSWLKYKYTLWRLDDSEEGIDPLYLLLILPLIFYLLIKVKKRSKDKIDGKSKRKARDLKDFESDLIEWLRGFEIDRKDSETLMQWIERIHEIKVISNIDHLRTVICSYYKYLYDPDGMSEDEIGQLIESIRGL